MFESGQPAEIDTLLGSSIQPGHRCSAYLHGVRGSDGHKDHVPTTREGNGRDHLIDPAKRTWSAGQRAGPRETRTYPAALPYVREGTQPRSQGIGMTVSDSIDDDKVCVVGGQIAWTVYRNIGAYICQANRYFQDDTGRLAFYSQRQIYGAAPRILETFPEVQMDDATAAENALSVDPTYRRLGLVIDAAIAEGHIDPISQVVLLTPIDDPATVTFEPVQHNGRGAWTQRQRYASLAQLVSASSTEELVAAHEDSGPDA